MPRLKIVPPVFNSPDIFASDKHPCGELDHVPAGAVPVPHGVQGGGDVAVTVVAAEVVHPPLVLVAGLDDSGVPAPLPALGLGPGVQLEVPGGPSERHLTLTDVVGPGKVTDHTGRHAYPHVTDEGKQPTANTVKQIF